MTNNPQERFAKQFGWEGPPCEHGIYPESAVFCLLCNPGSHLLSNTQYENKGAFEPGSFKGDKSFFSMDQVLEQDFTVIQLPAVCGSCGVEHYITWRLGKDLPNGDVIAPQVLNSIGQELNFKLNSITLDKCPLCYPTEFKKASIFSMSIGFSQQP